MGGCTLGPQHPWWSTTPSITQASPQTPATGLDRPSLIGRCETSGIAFPCDATTLTLADRVSCGCAFTHFQRSHPRLQEPLRRVCAVGGREHHQAHAQVRCARVQGHFRDQPHNDQRDPELHGGHSGGAGAESTVIANPAFYPARTGATQGACISGNQCCRPPQKEGHHWGPTRRGCFGGGLLMLAFPKIKPSTGTRSPNGEDAEDL